MTVQQMLSSSPLPQIETEILLAQVLQKNRSFIIAHPEEQLTQEQETLGQSFIARREKGEPIAYILGYREFYGLNFKVSPDTLIPRPETEDLVNEVEIYLKRKEIVAPKIIELGTGSGIIAIILAQKFPQGQVLATEISEKALEIAKENALSHKTSIKFVAGDLLTSVDLKTIKPDIIVANLPYIPDHRYLVLEKQIRDFEPEVALVGGPTGMEIYERLFKEVEEKIPGTVIYYELDGRVYQKN